MIFSLQKNSNRLARVKQLKKVLKEFISKFAIIFSSNWQYFDNMITTCIFLYFDPAGKYVIFCWLLRCTLP